jgi:hypothetical protein
MFFAGRIETKNFRKNFVAEIYLLTGGFDTGETSTRPTQPPTIYRK